MLKLFIYCFFLLCVNVLTALYTDVSSSTTNSANQHNHHQLHRNHHHHNLHSNVVHANDEHNNQKTKNSIISPLRSYNRRHLHRTSKLPLIDAAIPTSTALTTLTETSSPKSLKLTLITHDHMQNGFTNGFNNNRNFNRWQITQNDMNWHSNIPFTSVSNNNNNPSMGIVPTVITSSSTPAPATTYRHQINKKNSGPGRHVCVEYKTILLPMKQASEAPNRLEEHCSDCKSSRMYYEPVNNNIPQRATVYNCCPGWARISKNSLGCNKPICKTPCKNGGKCTKPDTCHCKTGYYGKHCELDVNECITEKPCDQTCYNTEGSYYCTCREGFILQQNKQSCKKVDTSYSGSNEGGNAFEARDLENDVDIEDLGLKISNIEKLMITEKQRNVEFDKRVQSTIDAINNMKLRLDNLEQRHVELNFIRDRLKSYEMQAQKLEYTVDLLYKCRKNPLIYCP